MVKNKIHKILLVEDDSICSSAMKLLLEFKGYIASIACNGLDAITMAASEKFDMILMDYQMPVMNGIEAAKSIRETNKDVIIISISSRNDREYINECQACGMNSHIPKFFIVEAIENNLLEAGLDSLNAGGRGIMKE